MDIKKQYEPQEIEKKWYDHWIEKGYFTPKIDKTKKPYTILIPPPNVTGHLHMGHVLNNTIQDVMIRYKRMTGVPTLWLPGVDHAGIATQNVVEKALAKEGKTRHDIGREELLERIWAWKHAKGGRIIQQLKKLGASCDWTRERFTMDEQLSDSVKEVFISLYEKGLIYKGKRIINWCPRCVTALANDEVEHEDEAGKLWEIKYPVKDSGTYISVETTRPETMLGDTAVAVNPADDRYKEMIGKTLILPLMNKEIPVIADDYVDIEFGSGCVKITPAHDPNDFEVGQRHGLEQILVIDEHGFMNENAPEKYQGMDRYQCRKAILEDLKDLGLLGNIKEHQHAVGHCYRCDTAIEPYLSDQWFVKMKPMAEKAIEVVKNGQVKFQPERWIKVYLHWMENIRDWCISRQIWWGHRIPAYYCESCGKMLIAKEMPETCPDCRNHEFKQDEDVLDTWFSSWLWPFSTLGWPNETEDLNYFLPTNLLVTAPGIIYLWVARMIMSTLEFRGVIPFDTVLLHGMVLDETGRKMSKSLGNSPDPIDIIDSIGADALRFSMIYNTPKGQDSYYSENILETGRNFANKIWNAFRYIMMNVENIEGSLKESELEMELADKWIYSRLQQTIAKAEYYYENIRLNDAALLIQEFIWKEFCSWYLELSKERMYNEDNPIRQMTVKYILLDVLQNSMRLLQPLMPFIAEEIWDNLKNWVTDLEESVVIASFPTSDHTKIDKNIEAEMAMIQESITVIRNLRKQVNLPPKTQVKISIKTATDNQDKLLNENLNYFSKLANVVEIETGKEMPKPEGALADVVMGMEIYLPLSGLIDVKAEQQRLQKQIDKLEIELRKINGKLQNEKFISSAPENIVAKEKEKYNEVKTKYDKTLELLNGLN
ncbi:MAG: valine--tRNA ligase [Candidatus Stygibacter australis]|nr:valine--tRNA ligase [Candidatus Stygibacter australis]MDP8321746.1 valine--tRNA ligase [Candidatus Stygibacter australis]